MLKSHNVAQMSANYTCSRSHLDAWIVRARPLARKIARSCLVCQRKYKVLLNQREGELPDERLFIGCPPFTCTAIDFLGPYKVKAMTNAQSQMKVWRVVFGCLNTGAVHIKLNKTYGMDALLLSITSFTSIHGYPAKFYTDKGTQLSKADSFINSKEDPANWT